MDDETLDCELDAMHGGTWGTLARVSRLVSKFHRSVYNREGCGSLGPGCGLIGMTLTESGLGYSRGWPRDREWHIWRKQSRTVLPQGT